MLHKLVQAGPPLLPLPGTMMTYLVNGLGLLMMASPFIAITVAIIVTAGWVPALLLWVSVGVVVGLTVGGAQLANWEGW